MTTNNEQEKMCSVCAIRTLHKGEECKRCEDKKKKKNALLMDMLKIAIQSNIINVEDLQRMDIPRLLQIL